MDSIDIPTDKHIHFDLSQNQTFIINNDIDTDNTPVSHSFPTITIITSFLFIINTISAYSKQKYIYAALFLCLTLTSIMYRYIEHPNILIVDRTVIFLIFIYGLYCLYFIVNRISKIYLGVIIATFFATVGLYVFGKINGCFCFHNDNCISENYMALVHLFGLIGHFLIINIY
uniref:Uncharacterized protein n=1 Tax=viral metagenome TaxID=1070528 RepID=A0A6C0HH44_9ZZZZ